MRATNIDEKGVKLAFSSFDALLSAVDILVAARVIVPGSPRATAVRGFLIKAKGALNAAALAQRAGNATSYAAAASDAEAAIGQARTTLKGVIK